MKPDSDGGYSCEFTTVGGAPVWSYSLTVVDKNGGILYSINSNEPTQNSVKIPGYDGRDCTMLLEVTDFYGRVASTTSSTVSDEEEYLYTGTCGENLKWYILKDYTLVITGYGPMDDYSGREDTPWYPYYNKITNVKLKPGITAIGNKAFLGLPYVKDFPVLPSTLQRIGDYAFSNSSFTGNVTIPGSVAIVPKGMCAYCPNLGSKVTFSLGVTKVLEKAFYECDKINEAVISESVEQIDGLRLYGTDIVWCSVRV